MKDFMIKRKKNAQGSDFQVARANEDGKER